MSEVQKHSKTYNTSFILDTFYYVLRHLYWTNSISLCVMFRVWLEKDIHAINFTTHDVGHEDMYCVLSTDGI